MSSQCPKISQIFVNNLFDHPSFKQNLLKAMKTSKQPMFQPQNTIYSEKASQIINDITSMIFQDFKAINERTLQDFKLQLADMRRELQRVSFSFMIKTDDLPKSFQEDPILEDQPLFDLTSIRRTIRSLQEKLKEMSFNSSVNLDSTQISKQSRFREDLLQDKITIQMSKMEQSFCNQYQVFRDTTNKRLQKQQKTINNILQTLNDLNGSSKKQNTVATLSSCKSATKLKTFFGFS